MTVTWTNQKKVGMGWDYDQVQLTYNGAIDPVSDDAVFYNSIGYATVWTNQAKS